MQERERLIKMVERLQVQHAAAAAAEQKKQQLQQQMERKQMEIHEYKQKVTKAEEQLRSTIQNERVPQKHQQRVYAEEECRQWEWLKPQKVDHWDGKYWITSVGKDMDGAIHVMKHQQVEPTKFEMQRNMEVVTEYMLFES